MRLPAEFYARVRADLRRRLDHAELDGVLVTHPADVAYLVGFFYAVTERPVYLWFGTTPGQDFCVVPHLDVEYAEAQQVDIDLLAYPEFPGVVSAEQHLADALTARGLSSARIGYSTGVAVATLGSWQERLPGSTFDPFTGIASMRTIKHPEEIYFHEQAAQVCDDMLRAGRALIEDAWRRDQSLPTEGEIARHVITFGTEEMYRRFDHIIFTTKLAGGLVYAGPNAARPHGLPSSRRLQAGDTLILSLGAAAASRFVESERTFILGEPTEQQRRYFEVTATAQQVGTEALRAGRTCAEANQICLDVIRDAGLGEHIRHRQGHGIGVQNHEGPWLDDGDDTVLAPGMFLSCEPGVYVPGHGGYRISDSVLVTDGDPRRLTAYPRSLEENVIA